MRLKNYPYSTHLVENVLKTICSEHGGIVQSLLVSPVKYSEELAIKSIVAQMPAYHKVLLHPELEMQYHLSGYGTFYEEALIRIAGEAIERYSLLVAQCTLQDKFRYASYDEIKKEGRVVPFEYLKLFVDDDYEKLNRGMYKGLHKLEKTDVVGWVRCPSLYDPSSEIWVPAQMLFVGYRPALDRGEVPFSPGFSTGTAAHTSPEKSLQGAILEFLEIDALMLQWYTEQKAPKVIVDDLTITGMLPELFGSKSDYEILALDLRVLEEVSAHVFGSVLLNRKGERPLIVFGAQGHLDPARAFYRSLMEAVAIAFLGIYGPLYLPQEYLTSTEGASFTDLDKNVAFFAEPTEAAKKEKVIRDMIEGNHVLTAMKSFDTGDVAADTTRLIRQLEGISEYAVFLDVTPPETREHGWYVTRAFFPELVTMCVPGVPYSQHPRIMAHGGIRNPYPHPLP